MTDNSRIVRYRRKPLTAEQKAELEALANLPEEAIDLSDMPELPESFFENALRAPFLYPPVRIDADVVEWFAERAKNGGPALMIAINRVLIDHVRAEKKKLTKKAG